MHQAREIVATRLVHTKAESHILGFTRLTSAEKHQQPQHKTGPELHKQASTIIRSFNQNINIQNTGKRIKDYTQF